MPDDAIMTDDEIALRAAINLLRDSIESGRMPSGLPLAPDAAALHERAAEHLDTLAVRRGAAAVAAASAVTKIADAAATTQAMRTHADAALEGLTGACASRVVNGYGVYGDPGWQGQTLCAARDHLIAALTLMDATAWPTDADYEAAENARAQPPPGSAPRQGKPGDGRAP